MKIPIFASSIRPLRMLVSLFACFASFLVVPNQSLASPTKLKVASLSTVLTDIASNVGGDRIILIPIVTPEIDPHLFEPTPQDIKQITSANIVLASGLGFESYLNSLETAVGKGPSFVIVGNAIRDTLPAITDHSNTHDHSAHKEHSADPHWWHSITNVKVATQVIADAFSAADPSSKAVFAQNAAAYQEKLDALANWTRLEIAQLPKKQRVLVTSHDALGYFARDYGFTVFPVQGITTNEEPSSKTVQRLIDFIKKNNVHCIFAEKVENPKILQEITKETGASLGKPLYVDGLGRTEANTYEAMMRYNVEAIVDGLSKQQ